MSGSGLLNPITYCTPRYCTYRRYPSLSGVNWVLNGWHIMHTSMFEPRSDLKYASGQFQQPMNLLQQHTIWTRCPLGVTVLQGAFYMLTSSFGTSAIFNIVKMIPSYLMLNRYLGPIQTQKAGVKPTKQSNE